MKKFAILLGLAASCLAIVACTTKDTCAPSTETVVPAHSDFKGEVGPKGKVK